MTIKVKFHQSPICNATTIIDVAGGTTISQAIKLLNIDTSNQPIIAGVGNAWQLRDSWNTPANDTISIYALQSAPASVLGALISLAAPKVAGATIGTALFGIAGLGTAVVMVAGSALIGEVFSAGHTDGRGQQATSSSPNYSLTAQGNRYRLGEAMAEIFGKVKVYPAYAVMPYSELANGEQYLYEIFHITNGTASVAEQKIGDTAIPSANDGFERWVLSPGTPPPDFFKNIYTSRNIQRRELFAPNEKPRVETYSEKYYEFDHSRNRGGGGRWRWRTKTRNHNVSQFTKWLLPANSTENISEIHLDMTAQFIAGPKKASITVEVQYQGKWNGDAYTSASKTTTSHTYDITDTAEKTTIKIPVSSGVYKVRLNRTDDKNKSLSVRHELWWTGMKAVLDRPIKLKPTHTHIARRTKASEISQAVRGKYSVVATRHIPTLTGFGSNGKALWSDPKPSQSIADSVAYIASKFLPADELDFQELYSLDKIWKKRGDKVNAIFDTTTNAWDAIVKMLATGRASPIRLWNSITFVRDQKQDLPHSMFTLADIEAGSFDVAYTLSSGEMADGIKVLFQNEDKNYEQDSVEWSEPNSPKKRVVSVRLPFITNKAHALREAKFRAREQFYRRKKVSFVVPVPAQQLLYGTKHKLQYPLVSSEVCSGKIVAFGIGTKIVKISDPIAWVSGQQYFIRINTNAGKVSDELEIKSPSLTDVISNIDFTDDEVEIVGNISTLKITAEDDKNGNASSYVIYKQESDVKEFTITELKPSGKNKVKITGIFDDDRVHAD